MYYKLIITFVILLIPLNAAICYSSNLVKENEVDSTNAVFVVLGFLDEYQGRPVIEDDPTVEWFYPREVEEAEIFRSYLNRIIEESNIQTELTKEIVESGHIHFHSLELRNLINEYYNIEPWKGSTARKTHEGPEKKLQFSFINSDIILGATDQEKLSYILGAYIRYGDNNTFRFANAIHKVKLIVTLLIDLLCKDVRYIDHSRPRAAPCEFEIKFVPSSIVEQWIKIKLVQQK